ncbi:NAD-dependent epimerase/dehydratase family protein [Burkholderia multivorans]|uniref:NAD-dependent epimerase/dehydratase family protein n=1 Tax=Burkholderia multivorans TaxID=87883 RepID=UPI000D003750|nr:NAD-dependent epimerase/dehydratase family protein [Burkholderia multivorans]PRE63360.1 NAD-dependent dehydratase [Burkholderia multivorans]
MMRIAISGANGFVGRAVSLRAHMQGNDVVGLVRRPGVCDSFVRECVIGDDNFAGVARGFPALDRCDAVIHLAARVHVMRDRAADPLAEFRLVNVEGSLNVARAALRAGARRFVLVSSIKALGESEPGWPWREEDEPMPSDPYGISKLESELAIRDFGRTNGLEVVIVRPPLVYGAGVGANFLGLMKAVEKGMPLPLASVTACRSLVYVDNLADCLLRCASDPRAPNECFHVADDDTLSIVQLVRTLGDVLGKPARLFSVPVAALHAFGKLTGRRAAVDRLTNNLRLDTRRVKSTLNWHPPYTTRQGLEATAAWYRSRDTRQ